MDHSIPIIPSPSYSPHEYEGNTLTPRRYDPSLGSFQLTDDVNYGSYSSLEDESNVLPPQQSLGYFQQTENAKYS